VYSNYNLFHTPNAKEIVLKARRRAITTAVDVAEITRRRFIEKINVTKISTETEDITEDTGKTGAVSTMEIR